MTKVKLQFQIEVGFAKRAGVRRELTKLKHKILFEEPDAKVRIVVEKGFWESLFVFSIGNVSKDLGIRINNAMQEWEESM